MTAPAPKCTILNYGMGNLRSVQKALEAVGAEAIITDQPDAILTAERLILPGVGAFGDGMQHLAERGLVDPIKAYAASGRPMLGICLGMQLMLTSSTEGALDTQRPVPGLDLISGRVTRFNEDQGPGQPRLKVPHMGWNALVDTAAGGLFDGLQDGDHVYFVHGYYATVDHAADAAAKCSYGHTFTAAIHKDNLWATQFHPEKSQDVGLKILANFLTF